MKGNACDPKNPISVCFYFELNKVGIGPFYSDLGKEHFVGKTLNQSFPRIKVRRVNSKFTRVTATQTSRKNRLLRHMRGEKH